MSSNYLVSINKGEQGGFTIVELLIVIVVIAILAAITITSYVGIQDRAYSSVTAENVKSYVNGLEMMRAEEGKYYQGFGCVGKPKGDDTTCMYVTYEGADCSAYGLTIGRNANFPVDEGFNNAMAKYLGSIPDAVQAKTVQTPEAIIAPGCTFTADITAPTFISASQITLNSSGEYSLEESGTDPSNTAQAYEIQYALTGDATCPVGGSVKEFMPDEQATSCTIYGGNIVKTP